MIKLQLSYAKNSYNHRQVYRSGDVCIYETKVPESGRVIGYEVFEVQKLDAGTFNGREYDAREVTPKNSDWGRLGYSVRTMAAAIGKVIILQQRLDSRLLRKGQVVIV